MDNKLQNKAWAKLNSRERQFIRNHHPSIANELNKKFKARQKIQGAVLRHLGKQNIGHLKYSRTRIANMTTPQIRRELKQSFNNYLNKKGRKDFFESLANSLGMSGGRKDIGWLISKLNKSDLEIAFLSIYELVSRSQDINAVNILTNLAYKKNNDIKFIINKLNRKDLLNFAQSFFGENQN